MHISEAHAQKTDVTWHISTKLSSLSCLIVLKLSNIHVKNTHELQKQPVISVKVNSWERIYMFVLDLCGSSVIYSK